MHYISAKVLAFAKRPNVRCSGRAVDLLFDCPLQGQRQTPAGYNQEFCPVICLIYGQYEHYQKSRNQSSTKSTVYWRNTTP